MYTVTNETSSNSGFRFRSATWEEFNLDLLMAPNAPIGADFLPAKVEKNGIELWSYKRDHRNYRGFATLVEVDDELVIVLATRFEIDMVLPIRDLSNMKKIGGEFVGGRKIKDLVLLKQDVAAELGLTPCWSKREAEMRHALDQMAAEVHAEESKAAQAKRAAERAAEEDRREHARAEREERRARIMLRRKIVGHTEAGDRRIGIPIVGDEWMCLRDGNFCISVTSYNEGTGAVGELIESFSVFKKGGGNPSRKSVAAVTLENPKPLGKVASAMKELKTVVVTLKGQPEEVIVADDIAQVRALCAQGLNSGTLAMCPKKDQADRFEVYRLANGKIESVTTLVRRT